MPYCCVRLEKAIKDKVIIHDGKQWAVAGCCGQCLLIYGLGTCPFCLADLPERKRATPGAGRYYTDAKGKRKTRKDKLKNQPSLLSAVNNAAHEAGKHIANDVRDWLLK